MANNTFESQPYDNAFKSLFTRCSSRVIVPLINEVYHPKIPLDDNVKIINKANELFLSEGDKNNFKVKITDAQSEINGKKYHMECDCYKHNMIILNMTQYTLGAGMNDTHLTKERHEYRDRAVLPESGVLFLRKTVKKKLFIEVADDNHSFQHEIHPLVLADYTIDKLVQRRLYILIPFYLFNHEKDLKKYSSDKACRKRVRKAMRQMIDALKEGLEKEEILPVDYDLLTDMMKVVTEGLTKKYRKAKKELDEIMDSYIYTTPSDRIYFQGRRDGKDEGFDEGKIDVYYKEMKMSPEDIAEKMNKPVDMVKKVINSLSTESK